MRKVSVCILPGWLEKSELPDRAVAVFDVLRATTTITAALAAGVSRIRIYPSPEAAAAAANASAGPKLLAGERRCLPPPGFDRGNSPGNFSPADAGKTLFFSTTNGTRALLAVGEAPLVVTASLVNASAAAAVLAASRRDILLVCAGTEGAPAMEDMLGCGAVIDALDRLVAAECGNDAARMAYRLFASSRDDIGAILRESQGGRNVAAAGLAEDIAFAARLDGLPVVGILNREEMSIVTA